jgi:hypothetical protein
MMPSCNGDFPFLLHGTSFQAEMVADSGLWSASPIIVFAVIATPVEALVEVFVSENADL